MGLGSGTKPIPDSGVKDAPDPGYGSATLVTSQLCWYRAILAFDEAEQTVCEPVVDGGPEERNQGLHVKDREDDSLLVGAAARVVQAVQQLAHRLTLHGACVVEP